MQRARDCETPAEVYSSLDRVDSAIKEAGGTIVAQVLTDHRSAAEMTAEPEVSVVFALTRVLSARAFAKQQGMGLRVIYIVTVSDVPVFFRMALASVDVVLTNVIAEQRINLPHVSGTPGQFADASFQALCGRVQARSGLSDLAGVLHALEGETLAAPPDKETDEIGYWTRVVELAAVFGELLRTRTGGHWVEHAGQSTIPFGFISDHGLVTFPTNRAQRLIAGEQDTSLFQLFQLEAARATHEAQLAILPSLRSRNEAAAQRLKFRPLVPYTPMTHAAPVVAYGSDSSETFAVLTTGDLRSTEALHADALANLVDQHVELEELESSILAVTGSFFATEKLLDVAYMRSLHVRLQTETLAVGVPRRGLMLVLGLRTADPHEADALAARTREEFSQHDQPISPLLLVVREGAVDGLVAAATTAPKPASSAAPPDATTRSDSPGLLRRLFRRS